jgi:hypothetical protein
MLGKLVDKKLGKSVCKGVDWGLFDEFIEKLKGTVEANLGDGEGWVCTEPKVEQLTGGDKMDLVMDLFRFGGTHFSVESTGDKVVNVSCHVSVAVPIGGVV